MRVLKKIKNRVAAWRERAYFITDYDWAQRQNALRVGETYDMSRDADEGFFARLYLEKLLPLVEKRGRKRDFFVLDACCGHGRLAVPLIERGIRVRGFDVAPRAIAALKERAGTNAEDDRPHAETPPRRNPVRTGTESRPDLPRGFRRGEPPRSPALEDFAGGAGDFFVAGLFEGLDRFQPRSVPLILCVEALYMERGIKEALGKFHEKLTPGGVVFLSLRPKAYYLRYFKGKAPRSLMKTIETRTEGRLPGGGIFNWFTAEEAVALLTGAGFENVRLFGIGLYAGIEGDPGVSARSPGKLDKERQRLLLELELKAGEKWPDRGRYILAIGEKPGGEG